MARSEEDATQPLLPQAETTHHDSDSPDSSGGNGGGTFKRNLGTTEAFGIVIGIVIGSGVFTSPGAVDTNVPSPGMALVVWLVAGILAWTGAATFAELGTAIPGQGGVQQYLQYLYGDAVGFLAAWTWILAIMPGTLAILSIVFVESAYSSAGVTDQERSVSHKLLSLLVLYLVTAANAISTRASTRLNGVFVVTKFASILAVVVAGLAVIGVQLTQDGPHHIGGDEWRRQSWFKERTTRLPGGDEVDWTNLSQWQIFGHYSAALYGALWAYSGWDKAIYVSAELSQPARQLPLALNSALPTVVICFLAANASYYILLPWAVVSTTDSVAVTAISRLLGRGAAITAAVLLCVVILGTLLGTAFVACRMTVAAADKGWLAVFFTRTGSVGLKRNDDDSVEARQDAPSSDAPINAGILSAIFGSLFILLGNFRDLLTLTGLGEYTFFFLAVLGAVVLRFRQPKLRRPCKPPIVVPAIFVVVSGFVVVRGAIFAPRLAAIIVGIWLIGLVYYWVQRRWRARRQT